MARARTVVTAGVLLYINNRLYGKVTGFSFSSETPREPINGIDSIDPFELAANTTRVTGTIDVVRTVFDGGAEGAGLTTNFERVPQEKYFSILLLERGSDTTLFRADYCSVNRQSWSFPSRGIVTGTIEFEGLSWSNEME